MRRPFIAALFVAALVLPGPADASVKVASYARNPTLKVVAGGRAEVDWIAGGRRHSVVVYRSGSLRYGAHLKGRDVSFPTTAASIPMAHVVRKTPNGSFWALQAWRRGGAWRRMMGILTHRNTGRFSLWIRPHWRGTAYRGTIIGPNWSWTLRPDAQALAQSSR